MPRLHLTGRVLRLGVAMVAGAFSASMIATEPVIGVLAGLFALMAAGAALTGRCPAVGGGARRRRRGEANAFGFPEAHENLRLLSGAGRR